MNNSSNFKQHRQRGSNFTVIPNEIFRDYELSAKAKGILTTLLSLPPNWEFSEKGLQKLFTDGLSSIKSGIKELEAAGYVARERIRNEKGQLKGTRWHVYEEPFFPEEQEGKTTYEPVPSEYYYDWMNE